MSLSLYINIYMNNTGQSMMCIIVLSFRIWSNCSQLNSVLMPGKNKNYSCYFFLFFFIFYNRKK